MESVTDRAQSLGYAVSVGVGCLTLKSERGEEYQFYLPEDVDVFLDMHHMSYAGRTRKKIAEDATQLGRIMNDKRMVAEQFERYWKERHWLYSRHIPELEARTTFHYYYTEGIKEHTDLRLKAVQREAEQRLPPGYSIDCKRGDGWLYPQYLGRDILRNERDMYRFRSEQSAREFVGKLARRLIASMETMKNRVAS